MRQLIYLSLTKWETYEERTHHFVRWYHSRFGAQVLWVNPYPTRLPELRDLIKVHTKVSVSNPVPDWLTVLSFGSLPIEPFPLSSKLNGFFWESTIRELQQFARREPTLLVIGKPSKFALSVLSEVSVSESWYDIMDSYSDFYKGYSRLSMSKSEQKILKQVDRAFASSRNLVDKWRDYRDDIQLVLNGLTKRFYETSANESKTYSFCYLGTMSSWFDWDFIKKLAEQFPNDKIVLIGPVFSKPTFNLPQNIMLMPPMEQKEALKIVRRSKVGLIPFIKNKLTEMVDPIKYYEYTALGLASLTTNFGQMSYRHSEPGVFVIDNSDEISYKAKDALIFQYEKSYLQKFIDDVKWSSRFDKMIDF